MIMLLKDGRRKVLTLSYDDGVVQDKKLIEILDKYGLKCTFNINSGLYCKEKTDPENGRLTKESAIKLYKNSNHEVAVHSYTHPFLTMISPSEVVYEIAEDRKNIERDYGVITRGMAYPMGPYNDTVIDIAKKCGIVYARTVKSTQTFAFPENWLALHPTCHHNYENLMVIARKFVEEEPHYGHSQMFYLWGHSYEFDSDNNWNVIEEFSKYMGGRDDIWYATNIEIYDYVQAYNRLEISYDRKTVHNPSAIDVWVEEGSNKFCIKGGETITL